ncbi:MAG TPA: hypothetical protein VE244_11750 [Nitrososphaeraceae archaeon]|jgi:hypothetical protein|nr:hypothetical protein [Nitrososphaeraceae archaeon]
MRLSSIFSRPLLIYDDKCSSCGKFAKAASILSRGWIRTAGHYFSEEAKNAKKLVFPADYDPTKMFWLINENGAYGARSGLLPVMKEIIIGIFKGEKNLDNYGIVCEYSKEMSCMSTKNIIKRFINMMQNSSKFAFENY